MTQPGWGFSQLSLSITPKKILGLLLLFAANIFGSTAYLQLPITEGGQEAAQGGGEIPWGLWGRCRNAAS